MRELESGSPGLGTSTALLLADAFLAIGVAIALAWAVEQVAVHGEWLWAALASTIGFGAARGVAQCLAARRGADASGRSKARVQRALIASVLGGGQAPRASQATGGTFVSLVVDELAALDLYLARFVPARRAAVFAPLMTLAAVAALSPVSAAILAATLLPFAALMAFAGAASAGESRRQFDALSRLSGLFLDRLRALSVVIAFGAQREQAAQVEAAAHEVASRTLRVLRLAFLSSAVLEFFSALCVALIAVYAGFELLGLLPFPTGEHLGLFRAFAVIALAPEFYAPMRRLAAAYHDRQAARTAAERRAAFLVANTTPPPGRAASPRTRAPCMAAPRIVFRHVAIGYPDAAILQDIDFEAPAGALVAVVGPSGSGKTTLLRSLLGMASLTQGAIEVDSRCLDAGESLAVSAAWLGQSSLIVPGTLSDNLLLGSRGLDIARLDGAVRAAGLERLVSTRPGGLDSPIDGRGSGLSGGERRRIALVRALLKDAPLWLLDEPTAHLDAATAHDIVKVLRQQRGARTLLVATHDPAIVAHADVVVRLEGPS